MKRYIPTPLADEFLQSVHQITEAETDPYFFTRLKARMEKEIETDLKLSLKPLLLVSLLAVFLFINGFFLVTQVKQNKETPAQGTSLQNFANGYDLSVSTSF